MSKLSTITKPQNYFYTVDGVTLRTTHDLFAYLSSCEQESFDYHVNEKKNDFVNWIRDTLLFPELASNLEKAKTLIECKQVLIDFFKAYEYHSTRVNPQNYFFTADGFPLRSAHELFYYINNCDDASYSHHVNAERNDFYVWLRDILKFPEMAEKIKTAISRQQAADMLKDFLLNSSNVMYDSEEYKRNSGIRMDKNEFGPVGDKGVQAMMKEDPSTSHKDVPASNTFVATAPIVDPSISAAVSAAAERQLEQSQTQESGPVINKNGFRQFTDEELEKFTKFHAKGDAPEADPKVEFLKASLEELKGLIKQLRIAEKDPLVADLMVRAIGPKIDYYAISKNAEDYDKIVQAMKDVQKEIAYYSEQKTVNFAQEILKDMELESVTIKKL